MKQGKAAIATALAGSLSEPITMTIENPMKGLLDKFMFGGGRKSYGSNPIFIPRKHTKQTYRSQQRAAKKRRRARQ